MKTFYTILAIIIILVGIKWFNNDTICTIQDDFCHEYGLEVKTKKFIITHSPNCTKIPKIFNVSDSIEIKLINLDTDQIIIVKDSCILIGTNYEII